MEEHRKHPVNAIPMPIDNLEVYYTKTIVLNSFLVCNTRNVCDVNKLEEQSNF